MTSMTGVDRLGTTGGEAAAPPLSLRIPMRRRLSFRQAWNAALIALGLGLAASLGAIAVDVSNLEQDAAEAVRPIMTASLNQANQAVTQNDKQAALVVLGALLDHRPIWRAELRPTGTADPIAFIERPRASRGLATKVAEWLPEGPVVNLPLPRGQLRVWVDGHVMALDFMRRSAVALGIALAASVGLTIILTLSFHVAVTKPFLRLADALGHVDPLRPASGLIRIPPRHTHDEVGVLAKAANALLLQVDRSLKERDQAEKAVHESNERLKLASRLTRSGVFEIDPARGLFFVSPEFIRMLGHEPEAMPTGPEMLLDLLHPDDRATAQEDVDRRLAGEVGEYKTLFRFRQKDGDFLWVEARGQTVIRGEDGTARLMGTLTDVSDRKRYEDQLSFVSTHDALTGLPNRALLQDRLTHAVDLADRKGTYVAVLLLNLDRFKLVNESLGHDAGDTLLRAVAQVLKGAVRTSDTVGRLGADEFLIIAENLVDGRMAARVAETVMLALAQPVILAGERLVATPSIGISVYPGPSRDPSQLLRDADMAMHQAKADGGNGYRFFAPEMTEAAKARLDIERALRRALEAGEFTLHYQPKVSLPSLEVVGVEALIRWTSADLGFVPPNKFIPVAEETGLIIPIGEWVVQESLRQIRAWEAAGYVPVPVAVNVSVRQLAGGNFAEWLLRQVEEYRVKPSLLEVEVTETALMSNLAHLTDALALLRRGGVKVAIDDFGTGYSSLAYLRRLPITTLKVDRSFISDVTTNADTAAIAATIIAMGRQLGLTVVAEGIETEDQIRFLREHQCHALQGYFVSKPIPGGDLATRFLPPALRRASVA